jgi:hypothetical protein
MSAFRFGGGLIAQVDESSPENSNLRQSLEADEMIDVLVTPLDGLFDTLQRRLCFHGLGYDNGRASG